MTGPALLQIPIRELIPDPRNPRRAFDTAELERLAASIAAQGIIEPLVVRPIDGKDPGGAVAKYVIVAGERRWRAAQLKAAGPLTTVPAVVRAFDAAGARAAQLAENDQRVGLTPLERAESYRRWLEPGGKVTTVAGSKMTTGYAKQKELAAAIGETEAHVSQVLALLELPKPAQALIDSGAYTFAHGRELNRLRDYPAAQRAIVQLLEERVRWGYTFTTRELAQRVSTKIAQAKAAAARKAVPLRRYHEEQQRREQIRKAGLRAAAPRFQKAFNAAPVHKLVARIPRPLVAAIARGLRLPGWGEEGELVGALKVGAAPARRVAAWLWLRTRTAALKRQVAAAGVAAQKAAAVSARKAAPARKGGRK